MTDGFDMGWLVFANTAAVALLGSSIGRGATGRLAVLASSGPTLDPARAAARPANIGAQRWSTVAFGWVLAGVHLFTGGKPFQSPQA
ncbi:MAG: hypothetical protein ACYDC1_09285 [Limisphaerales bacterium]